MKRLSKRSSTQRGAALLTAMLIVVLVATLASAMIWQQWRAVQVESAERARTQAAWILTGSLDWARLILREDARSGRPTTLSEPWATPLAEARLSTFLSTDRDNTDSGPEAFLSGSIVDAQSRYNLRNLIDDGGKVVNTELLATQRLFESIGVAPGVATRLATGLRDAMAPFGSPDRSATAPLTPRNIGQLGWLGIDAGSVRRLAPYVVILPVRTAVNLNTASREVIAANVEGLDMGGAQRLVQARQRTPFKTLAEAQALLPANLKMEESRVGVLSNFFEVHGRLRLDDRVMEELSLVERRGLDIVALQRRRISSKDGIR